MKSSYFLIQYPPELYIYPPPHQQEGIIFVISPRL